MSEHNGESWTRDINVPLILLIGLISGLLLLVIVIGAQGWYYYELTMERQAKIYEGEHRELAEQRAEQQQRLETLRWVDEDQERAAVPLEDAMARYIEKQQGEQ